MFIAGQNKKYYARLWHLLAAGFFFSSILPILVIAAASIASVKQLSLQEVEFRARQVVEHRQDVLDTYLSSQLHFFSALLRLSPPEALHSKQALQALLQAMSEQSTGGAAAAEVVGLQVLRLDGTLLATTGLDLDHFGKTRAEIFTLPLEPPHGQAISALFSDQAGHPYLALTLHDPGKGVIFFVLVRADQLKLLLKSALTLPDDAVFLGNSKNSDQIPVLSVLNREGAGALPLRTLALPVALPVDGLLHAGDWLYTSKRLSAAPCFLVFQTRAEGYLRGYLAYRNSIIAIVVSTSVVFLFFSIAASRSIVFRIKHSDEEQIIRDQQLADMNKMASLGKLAAGVAHEINNPLQLIQMQAGWIEGLLKEESAGLLQHREEYLSSVGKIRKHVKRAATITRRLLGFSRKINDERDADINALLQTTVSFVESDAYKNQVQLRLNLDPSLPVVRTDTSQLQQILLNLLENALDAVGSNGHIEMSTSAEEGAVQVRIGDNGPGIAPELMKEKIWQPFFTTKPEGKGTGLGLAICRDIARKLGGNIWAENVPQGGAAFILRLPYQESVEKKIE